MAIKTGTPFQQIHIQTKIQAIAVQIFAPITMTIASVYLPPRDKNAGQLLDDLFGELPRPTLVLGDLNAHHSAWGSRINNLTSEAKKRGDHILDLVVHYDMVVLNNGTHTRIDPSSGASQALDVSICSTSHAAQLHWRTLSDFSGTDHLPILIGTSGNTNEPKNRPKWIFDKADWNYFEEITSATLHPNAALTVDEFTERIITAANSSIPKTSGIVGRKSVVWWNEEIKAAIKNRRKCLRALRRLSDNDPRKPVMLKQFQKARSVCRKTINDSKQKSWEKFVESINPNTPTSQVWNSINRLQGKRKNITITLNLTTGHTNDGEKIANALADEYQHKSSNENYSEEFRKKHRSDNCATFRNQRPNLHKNYNVDFTIEELMWALDRCTGSSTGNDNISYIHLQRLPFSSKVTLLELFNRVWDSGSFPAQWKVGTVIPIPKPDADRSKPEGYRPITLLSCVGKLFERMVNRRLITELESTGKLDPRQHGFRAGKGVDTHFAKLESLICLENDEHVEIVSLDISKAYDTTYRPEILRTLTEWRISGRMMNIISSFLCDRYFQVAANGSVSSLRKAENGVPQGSVLSVTLFLVAMQPIFKIIPTNAEILLYADDVILIVKGKDHGTIRRILRKAVAAAVRWAASVGFSIAPTKSKLLHACLNGSASFPVGYQASV